MNSLKTYLGAVALFAVTIGGNAIAGGTETPPSEVVSFAELNLKSPAGVAKLYRRIQKAADKVCEHPPAARQLSLVEAREACKARATERAVKQVGVPALNALHRAKTVRDPRPAQVATNK